VTKETYAGLIGPYDVPEAERVPCQLQRKHKRCNQSHGIGWLARTTDQREACIGGDCAARYFGAKSEFSKDRARANREVETDALLQRIHAAYSNTETPLFIDQVLANLRRLYDSVTSLIGGLPADAVRRIRDMAKVGRSDVMIEVRYEERTENPQKPKIVWQPRSIGAVRGLNALNLKDLRTLMEGARSVKEVWADRNVLRETSLRALRARATVLESLPSISAKLVDAGETWSAFSERANLDRCAFLASHESDQRQVFWAARGTASSRHVADVAWRTARAQISTEHGNRQFRAAQV